MSTRVDRLNNELMQLKLIVESSQNYVTSYFAELKNSAQNNADLVEKINFYENECADNQIPHEIKSNFLKKIQLFELKLEEFKQKEDQDSPTEEEDEEEADRNGQEEDEDDDDYDCDDDGYDNDDDDDDFNEIKQLIQAEKLKAKKILFMNKTILILNSSTCQDPSLMTGQDVKLAVCMDECFSEKSIEFLKKK